MSGTCSALFRASDDALSLIEVKSADAMLPTIPRKAFEATPCALANNLVSEHPSWHCDRSNEEKKQRKRHESVVHSAEVTR